MPDLHLPRFLFLLLLGLIAADSGRAAEPPVFGDLSGAANLGFADPVKGDGQGGWSDQGPENDFREFDVKAAAFGGIPFKIVDPQANAGRAVLTFKSPQINVPLTEADLPLPPEPVQYLYLLHTTCWNKNREGEPIGTLRVGWTDGPDTVLEVQSGREAGDWWNPAELANGAVAVSKDNRSATVGVYLSKFKLAEAPRRPTRLTVTTAGNCIWIVVAATLSAQDYPLPNPQLCRIEAGREWQPANFPTPVVEPGSILDLSALNEPGPAGQHGPVKVRPDGHLAFRDRPDQIVRFLGDSVHLLALNPKKTDHAAVEEYAALVRRQGYNLVRFHFLDHYLTTYSQSDLEFDPDALDRFDYLVHCLKQNGVYLYVDAMSSWRGYKKGYAWDDAAKAVNFKARIYVEEEVRDHWKAGATQLLRHKNPYTQTCLAEDPQVVAVLCFNEQNLSVWGGLEHLPAGFTRRWREWLQAKYATPAALAQAWTKPNGQSDLPAGAGFAEVPAVDSKLINALYDTHSRRGRDFASFLTELHRDLLAWYTRTLREVGYRGLISQYDWLPLLQDDINRAEVELVSMHGYHAHPSNFILKNSVIDQGSSLHSGGNYFCAQALTRFGGRPFFNTEYGHVFWNRYRHEEGPFYGSYAALQGFDCLIPHAGPIRLAVKEPIKSFSVGIDPIARASQVVTAFAFVRGDVSRSPHYVDVRLDPEAILREGKNYNGLSADQARLALLTGAGLSLTVGGLTPPPPADLTLPVFGVASVRVEQMFAEVRESGDTAEAWQRCVAELRARGILPAGNRTDPAAGIYESDTGELRLEMRTNRLAVVTTRLESACLDPEAEAAPVELCALRVESSSVPAAVTAVAVEGETLAASPRVLLVYATDALNSGMTFSAPSRRRLQELGTLPILLQTGRIELNLANAQAERLKAWAVDLCGRRAEEIPLRAEAGRVHLSLDTADLKSGPTPFIELAIN